jgi:hypothetical protein
MGAVAVVAACFAIFRIPWLPVRASALFTLLVFILLTATLGSILTRGASWIGFALFGWTWLVISYVSLAIGDWNSDDGRNPVPMSIASIWLAEFHSYVLGIEPPAAGEAVASIPDSRGGSMLMSYALVQVCHLWSSLLAACIGGVLAQWLDDRRPRSRPDDAVGSNPLSGGGP